MKLGRRHNYHKGRAALRIYANQPTDVALVLNYEYELSVSPGLVYTAPGGQALLQLVDHHGGSLLVLGLALAEVVGVAWVYGVNSIIADLNIMLDRSEGEREIVYG